MSRIVLLAGYRRSLASIVLLAQLARTGSGTLLPRAVVCPSEFSLFRLMHWYRRYRSDLLPKILSGLGFTAGGQFDQERQVLLESLRDLNVPHRNLRSLCKELG